MVKNKNINIPNMLTVFRIILVPIYLLTFFSKNIENNKIIALIIFIIAGITDFLDGYIARKYNLTTKLGALIDPLADKLMTFAVLISFTSIGVLPKWIIIVLSIKEIAMIIGGGILLLFEDRIVIPANKYGKIATVSFYTATLSMGSKYTKILSKPLFIITVLLNIIAFINYLIIFIRKDKKYR